MIICYDNAYSGITFDGYSAPSILRFTSDNTGLIEFHSCSKTFSMTGYRIGFGVGDSRLITGLKTKIPSRFRTSKIHTICCEGALNSYTGKDKRRVVRDIVDIYDGRLRTLLKSLWAI